MTIHVITKQPKRPRVHSKYKKFNLKNCIVPILKRPYFRKCQIKYWDDINRTEERINYEYLMADIYKEKIKEQFAHLKVPDFSTKIILSVAKQFHEKTPEVVTWINAFVYNQHYMFFAAGIVPVCELKPHHMDKVAKYFSSCVQPEVRRHYIMACIAREFDKFVYDTYEVFRENMLVSYIESLLHHKLENMEEFRMAACQYIIQRIIYRTEAKGKKAVFSEFRIGDEGWIYQEKDEPLNYYVSVTDGNDVVFTKFILSDLSKFKRGIIYTNIPPKRKEKQKKQEHEKEIKKSKLETKETISSSPEKAQKQTRRGRPPKRGTYKNKENVSEQSSKIDRQRKGRIRLPKQAIKVTPMKRKCVFESSEKELLPKRRGRPKLKRSAADKEKSFISREKSFISREKIIIFEDKVYHKTSFEKEVRKIDEKTVRSEALFYDEGTDYEEELVMSAQETPVPIEQETPVLTSQKTPVSDVVTFGNLFKVDSVTFVRNMTDFHSRKLAKNNEMNPVQATPENEDSFGRIICTLLKNFAPQNWRGEL